MGTRALPGRGRCSKRQDRRAKSCAGEKEQLLRSARDEVSVALPEFHGPGLQGQGLDGAVNEAAQLVSRLAGARLDEERPPLEAAALLVPDDLVILLRQGGRWVMAAGVVCFPRTPSRADGRPARSTRPLAAQRTPGLERHCRRAPVFSSRSALPRFPWASSRRSRNWPRAWPARSRATPPDLAAYRFGAVDTRRLANWLEGHEPR